MDEETLDQAGAQLLPIAGMGCPTCAALVRDALLAVPDVLAAEVEVETGVARVWLNGTVDYTTLVDAVHAAGVSWGHRYLVGPASGGVDTSADTSA